MFSLEKINAKMAKGSKKKVKKPLEPKKKKAGSFLSLETSSALFKGVTVPSETDSVPRKKKDSVRYYNYSKLIEDVVENPADDWGLSHKTPSKYKKSQFLKLNKTSKEIMEDAVDKQANRAARKKKTLKNKEVDEDMEIIETFPDPLVNEMEVVSVKKKVQRKRKSDGKAHKVNLEKQKSKNELPLKEIKDSDFETDVSNINLHQEECFDKDSLTTNSGMSNLYVDALTLSEDALLVAFFPNTVIHFCGNVWVKLLAGSIRVFGYKFSEGDLYPVFSHQSHSLLNIKVLGGKNVKQFSMQQLKERDIPSEWVQRIDVDETCQLAIIKLCRLENSSTKIIQASKVLNHIHIPNAADRLFEDVLGIKVVNLKAEKRNPLLHEPSEWNKCLKSLLKGITKEPRIIVAGGKGVGKSTFFKYLINRFLCDSAVNAVSCMEIDPGQPEFSLPSVVSLTKVVNPALGPPFTHMNEMMDLSDQTQLLIGDINVTNVLMEYLSAVQKFEDLYSKKYSNIPLVVNTMGFTAGTGSDIMVAVLRILKPTHVIVIESPKPELNYQHSLDPHFINNVTNRGIFDKKLFSSTLNYKLISFRAATSYQVKAKNLDLRDLRILSNLAKLWKDEEFQLNSFNCKTAIMIPWNSVAIHVIGSLLPVDYMLEAINANLVALCKIDEDYFEEIREEYPRQIKNGSHWYTSCKCLGWGIVRGIDPVSRELHILTPLDNAVVMLNVNALILTKTCLPDYLFKLFSGGKGGPYLQKCQNNENKHRKRRQ